jgi:hypothetical protein
VWIATKILISSEISIATEMPIATQMTILTQMLIVDYSTFVDGFVVFRDSELCGRCGQFGLISFVVAGKRGEVCISTFEYSMSMGDIFQAGPSGCWASGRA